jgi:hypothetical protein
MLKDHEGVDISDDEANDDLPPEFKTQKSSQAKELCLIPVHALLSAGVNAAGAGFLQGALKWAGYNVLQSASFGGIGTGIVASLVYLAKQCKKAVCGEAKATSVGSKLLSMVGENLTSGTMYVITGSVLGWTVMKLNGLTDMELEKALYSGLAGCVLTYGGVTVVACAGAGICLWKMAKKSYPEADTGYLPIQVESEGEGGVPVMSSLVT